MSKLTIMRGISGSGKSTWALAQWGAVVVSRDSLRETFFGSSDQDYYQRGDLRSTESLITQIQDSAIESALRSGYHVIVDNTNVEWKYVKQIAAIGQKVGVNIVVKTVDVPLSTALERNRKRGIMGGRAVPDEVIRKQHSQLQGSKDKTLDEPQVVKPYTGTPGKPKAFLVDIDGTLAHMRDYRGPFEWHKVGLDDVDETVADVVRTLIDAIEAYDYKFTCIVMSGRDEVCRAETEQWLDKHSIAFDHLFMRPEKDMRKDNIIKAELFDNYVRDNFDVKFVIDDRDQVVKMWREMGIKCLQVEPGDF
jgi:predicted kinase